MRELWRERAAIRDRSKREHDQALTMAWYTAALQRQDKLPSLDKVLGVQKRKPQTIDEQRAMLHMLAQAYGGTVRKTRLIRRDKAVAQ